MRAIIAIAVTLAATPALAQGGKVWTPAPVPGTSRDNGPPADRAGNTTSTAASTPFSASPTGAATNGGRTSPSELSNAPPATGNGTPDLGK